MTRQLFWVHVKRVVDTGGPLGRTDTYVVADEDDAVIDVYGTLIITTAHQPATTDGVLRERKPKRVRYPAGQWIKVTVGPYDRPE